MQTQIQQKLIGLHFLRPRSPLPTPPLLELTIAECELRNYTLTNQRSVIREPHGPCVITLPFTPSILPAGTISLSYSQIFVQIDKVWAYLTVKHNTESCLVTTEVVRLIQAAVQTEKGKKRVQTFCPFDKKMRHANRSLLVSFSNLIFSYWSIYIIDKLVKFSFKRSFDVRGVDFGMKNLKFHFHSSAVGVYRMHAICNFLHCEEVFRIS